MILCIFVYGVCSGVSQTDFKDLDTIFGKVCKEKQVFERLVVSKEEALELFKYNAFKCVATA